MLFAESSKSNVFLYASRLSEIHPIEMSKSDKNNKRKNLKKDKFLEFLWQTSIEHIHMFYVYTLTNAQGPDKVGKTNIITRFTKNQFTEAHNMTLEGQQTVTIDLDGRLFQILLYDTAGQQGMHPMKSGWRQRKDGFVWTFAINSRQSFLTVLKEIEDSKKQLLYKNLWQMASVLVGNKMDLEEYREVENKEAKAAANKLGIRYMEISAKTSMRCQIQRIFFDLIDMNELRRFDTETNDTYQRRKMTFPWEFCQRNSICQLF